MFLVIKDGSDLKRLDLEAIAFPYVYKGIEIIKKDEDHYLVLKPGYYFPDKGKRRKIEVRKYIIKHRDLFNDIEIYVYENDRGFHDYRVYCNVPFIIADNPKAPVISLDPYLKDVHLYLKDGAIKTNYDSLLLNDRIYANEVLKDGDKLTLLNHIFYYYDAFLYMNDFLTVNKLPEKQIEEVVTKYEHVRPRLKTYFLPAKKELEAPKFKEYAPVRVNRQRKLLYQIGPGITMSLAMLAIAGINVYNAYLNDQPLLNSMVYVLMPVTMLLSGVLWPSLSNHHENKANMKEVNDNKNKYRDYLIGYDLKVQDLIREYLKQENEHYFQGLVDEDKLFYITDKSPVFLNISVGLVTYKKEFEFKEGEDDDINEDLNQIRHRLNNIEDCPYFLDLKRYYRVSIYSYQSRRAYFLKRFLLELSSKYHYDDLYLAIYSEDLNVFADFFGLPQLIFNNSRLTLNKKREIQELNNLKLDRPLILLVYDHIDFIFTNKEIRVLYFTSDKNDIYKDSEVLLEYLDEEGYIYKDEKAPFKYSYQDIDFKGAAGILSAYQKVDFINKTTVFKDIFPDFDVKSFYQDKQQGLRADFATLGKDVLSFDLHESKNGPHGLIGGSTGSGKSELIVSLLLSLGIRYRPDYLNVILIDYKGGGIKESLSYKGQSLPHIIASIDNLEADIFERLIVAIGFECKRRQRLFKELSNKAMTSIMNIDDYLDNDHSRYGLPHMAHLLIVVDEFAELKKENPDIIKELISFSRIGRSLGLHLILATQRPSGVIDEEIWSNSRFKIALKVLSDKDSNDIIRSKEAAYLNNPGDFYLGIDDNLIKAKALYSKSDINNGEAYEVSLLDNRLDLIKKKTYKKKDPFTEAAYFVNKILSVTKELNITNEKLEFTKAEALSRTKLENIYGKSDGIIIGEIDDYLNAAKGLLTIPENENVFIFSGRDHEIDGILNNVDKRTIVIASMRYENKMISDSLLYDETEDLTYLFDKLLNDDEKICLVIEDLSCLLSYGDKISSRIYQLLRRSSVSGLNIIALSKQSSISFKLLNCFKHKYAIEIFDDQDLLNIFTQRCEYKGRSFFLDDKIKSFVPCLEERFVESGTGLEPYVEQIPSSISFERNNEGTLLGYGIVSRKPVYLKDNENLFISSYDEETIERMKNIYKDNSNICVCLYDKKTEQDHYNRYLWVGEGLYNQRLFYMDGKEDVKNNEACYFKGNKGEMIRIVDHE